MADAPTQIDLQVFIDGVQKNLSDFFAQTQAALFKAQADSLIAQAESAKAQSDASQTQLVSELNNQSLTVQSALSKIAAEASIASSANAPASAHGPQVVQTSNTTDFSAFRTPALIIAASLAIYLLAAKKIHLGRG